MRPMGTILKDVYCYQRGSEDCYKIGRNTWQLTPEKRRRLHAASRRQITNDTRLLKRQLMEELVRLDRETSFEAGRGRQNSDGVAAARVRRGE